MEVASGRGRLETLDTLPPVLAKGLRGHMTYSQLLCTKLMDIGPLVGTTSLRAILTKLQEGPMLRVP